jgi:mannosyltransferase
VVLLALVIRLPALGAPCFWADEVVTADRIDLPLESMLALRTLNVQAPLYYLLVRGWAGVFGSSDAALRAFSVLAGVAGVFLVIMAAWRFFGRRAGILAGLVLALHPVHVYFSREARGYSLMIALEAATFVLLAPIVAGRARWLTYVGLAGLQMAGVSVHYSLAVVAALQAAVVVASCLRRRDARGLIAYAAIPVVCALAATPALLAQAGMLNTQWGERGYPGARAAVEIVDHVLGNGPWYIAPAGLVLVLVFALLSPVGGGRERPGHAASARLLLLATVAAPVLVCVLLPLAVDVPLKLRYALSALPPLAIMVGAGMDRAWARGGSRRTVAIVASAVVLLGMAAGNRVLYSPRLHQDWRPVADYVADVYVPERTEMLVRLKDQGKMLRRYSRGRFEWQGMDSPGFDRAVPEPVDLEALRSRAHASGKDLILLLYQPRFAAGSVPEPDDAAGGEFDHAAWWELSSDLRLLVLASSPVQLPDPREYGSMDKPRTHVCAR